MYEIARPIGYGLDFSGMDDEERRDRAQRKAGAFGTGIVCRCGGKTQVYDSRPHGDGIKRRRKCTRCQVRFATIEERVEE